MRREWGKKGRERKEDRREGKRSGGKKKRGEEERGRRREGKGAIFRDKLNQVIPSFFSLRLQKQQ